jgi:hypothetical protein
MIMQSVGADMIMPASCRVFVTVLVNGFDVGIFIEAMRYLPVAWKTVLGSCRPIFGP